VRSWAHPENELASLSVHVPAVRNRDPAAFEGAEEEKLDKFREVRDLIEQQIITWLDDIGSG
jgi:hypothetical protein